MYRIYMKAINVLYHQYIQAFMYNDLCAYRRAQKVARFIDKRLNCKER